MDETTVVVTGAAAGVGAAVARAFGEAGAHVVVGGRAPDRDALEDVANDIGSRGGTATPQVADVRDEYDVERLLETAARASDGGVDVVVAAAAAEHLRSGPLIDAASYAAFDDALRTNVRGVFATFREAVPHLAPDARLLVPVRTVDGAGADGAAVDPGDVSTAGAVAVARAFADAVDVPVGAVAVGGGPATEGEDAPAVGDAADGVRWAATAADPDGLDGSILVPPENPTGPS